MNSKQFEKMNENITSGLTSINDQLVRGEKSKNIQEQYDGIVKQVEGMMDLYLSLVSKEETDVEAIKDKASDVKSKGLRVMKTLEFLTSSSYEGGDLIKEEKEKFKQRVIKIGDKWSEKNYKPEIEDVRTLNELVSYIAKSSKDLKIPVEKILRLSQDEVYKLFEEKLQLSSKTEKDDRTFEAVARAYQHTNEPMEQLVKDLKLNLKGDRVLAITCSGDPLGFFMGLGASEFIGFDTSHKATIYGEFKETAIKELSFNEYRTLFGLNGDDENTSTTQELYKKIQAHLTTETKEAFDAAFKRSGNSIQKVLDDKVLFRRQSYACPHPDANLFSKSEKHYKEAKARIKEGKVRLIPGGLMDVVDSVQTDNAFDAIYLSNAPDHFRDESGELNHQESTFKDFYVGLDKMTRGSGSKIIFNFQWSEAAFKSTKSILGTLGYQMKTTKSGDGCGYMAVATKK